VAATFARAGVDTVVTDVAGCGSMLKEYAELLGKAPQWTAMDVTELLVELGEPVAPRHPVPLTVAYHDACHLARAGGRRTLPARRHPAAARGIWRTPAVRVGRCKRAAAGHRGGLGRLKATALLDAGAQVVVAVAPCWNRSGAAWSPAHRFGRCTVNCHASLRRPMHVA
jgi:glycolate oxidase iron-sulfur subunit